MSTWLDDISLALANLGGIAHYDLLYPEIKKVRAGALPNSWKQIIQRTIQDHSANSDGFKGNNVFYSVKGIGSGVWGLRSHLVSTPPASDIEPPSAPERLLIETYRVLRDTELARKIKALHKNTCQLCGQTVTLKDGATYAEAHHIKPLGSPHNGPDVAENIVVLCPNHHVMLDYGAIPLEAKNLRSLQGHLIGSAYIAYHNEHVFNHDEF
ncbi:MAG: HNH endonuclease [Burkholderiales bacterium]|nr:HNH endonuclease [Burkholderiales bacterium]